LHNHCKIGAAFPSEREKPQITREWNSSYVPEVYIRFRMLRVKALRRRERGLQAGCPTNERPGWGDPLLRHVEAGNSMADGTEKVGSDGVDALGDLIGGENVLAVSPVYCTYFA
jgi:hypothetical protein